MKVSHCLKKVFNGRKASSFTKKEEEAIRFIVSFHDFFYRKIKKVCEDYSFPLDEVPKGKRFYYYLKPEVEKKHIHRRSNFDNLMFTNTIAIVAKNVYEAEILGFILKTIINDSYDSYNDRIASETDNLGNYDDTFLYTEIKSINEPKGIFKNKPEPSTVYESKGESIAFGRAEINKLLLNPIHLALKGEELLKFVLN